MNLKHILFIGIVVIAILVAATYQSIQRKEAPVIESCEEQFIATQDVYQRADCYAEAAIASLDPAICKNVGISTVRQSECIKAVIDAAPYDPAVYKKLRDRNLRGLFSYKKKNLSIEEFNPSYTIDDYFLDIIRNKTDISVKDVFICEEIQSHFLRSSCYNKIAIAGQDTSICKKIPIISRKDHCYRYVALEKLDASVCQEIVDIITRGTCYLEVAGRKQDSLLCDKIEIPLDKDSCYSNIAEVTQNALICDKIQNKNLTTSCYLKVQAREVK